MKRVCPDCGVALTPIKLLDNAGQHGYADSLFYTTAAARRNLWNGRYPVEGSVHAFMCPDCGRVLLYADTAKDKLPVPSEAPRAEASALPLAADQPLAAS